MTIMISHKALAADNEEAILLVAFGTSTVAGQRAYGNIEKIVKQHFPETPIYWAFTSGMIQKKLARQGKTVLSPGAALRQIHQDGIVKVVVQSLHIAAGKEFYKLLHEIKEVQQHISFQALSFGRPLLFHKQDLELSLAAALDSLEEQRTLGEAVLFMGHGHEHGHGDLTFIALNDELNKKDDKAFLATVAGGLRLDELIKPLKESGAKKVWLSPFMIVAGDHAQNDLCGPEPDSWRSILEKEGFACQPNLVGLGELDGIAAIFVKHLKMAQKEL